MAKKEEITGIEIHSEEVQDIMGSIPGRFINWGATIIFSLFLMLVIGSYFFSFKEMVSAPMIITTSNPPAPLISKSSGKIEHWFVQDGDLLDDGDYVALISNSAKFEDVLKVSELIDSMGAEPLGQLLFKIKFPKKLILGNLQTDYNQLLKNWGNYLSYETGHFLDQKIDLLRQEKSKQESYYTLLLEQKKLQESELELAEKKYKRCESILDKGGVSISELDDAKTLVIQGKKAYLSFLGSLRSSEINLLAQEKAILELTEQNSRNIEQFEMAIEENINNLKNAIQEWKNNFLISSPIKGTVTLTRFWSENHVITVGEKLATIIPSNDNIIVCRASVSSAGIGKVQTGQKVNLKLSGFPFMQYGMLTGTVDKISLVPENNEYIVEISLDDGMRSNYKEKLQLIQEMEGTAEIITKKTRLIYRFIEPLKAAMNQSQ